MFFKAVSAVCLCTLVLSCSKTGFSGKGTGNKAGTPEKTTLPTPNESDSTRPTGLGTPTGPNGPTGPVAPNPQPGATNPPTVTIPVEDRVELKLNLVNLNHEAWFRNCFEVSLANFSTPPVRFCNKGETTAIASLHVHRSACNVLRFKVETTYNNPNSCQELSPHNWDCSYSNKIDRTRVTSNTSDRTFFKVFDATRVGNIIVDAAFRSLVRPVAGTASAQNSTLSPGISKATRVYFEDLSNDDVDYYMAGGYLYEKPTNITVDFDDMVFDIQAGGANFTVEGANSWWSPFTKAMPREGAQPPACL